MKAYDIPKVVRQGLIAEGKAAYEQSPQQANCPYPDAPSHSGQRYWWNFGYYRTLYAERDADAKRIADWLDWNVSIFNNRSQSEAFAAIATRQGSYDRNKPITNNRICGVEFTIPAPATLP